MKERREREEGVLKGFMGELLAAKAYE